MTSIKEKKFETEQAELMAKLTLQIEKFCQEKERFFAKKFNLTPMEFRCLRLIDDNIMVSSKMLVKSLKLSPGRISHLTESLEKKGLVTREIDANDRRFVTITLTDKAGDFMKKLKREYINLHRGILNYLPKDKRVEIFNNLEFFFLALKDWSEHLRK